MNSAFDKLCLEINFKKTPAFKNIQITKAALDEEENIFELHFQGEEIIPFIEMEKFLFNLNNNFKYQVNFQFNILSPIYEKEEVQQYLKWIIGAYIKNPGLSQIISHSIENITPYGEIIIKCNNEYSINQISYKNEDIVRILKKFGFAKANLNIQFQQLDVLETAKNNLMNEIKKSAHNLQEKYSTNTVIKNNYSFEKHTIYELQNKEGANRVQVQGWIFLKKIWESKNGTKIILLSITDFQEAIHLKAFVKNLEEFSKYDKLDIGNYILVKGSLQMDAYSKQKTIFVSQLKRIKEPSNEIVDQESNPRVELSCRSRMSTMDGVVSPKQIVQKAIQWGHKAIAIIDSESVQSFPEFYKATKNTNVKPIYGTTLNVIPKISNAVYNPLNRNLISDEYIIFDLETTGLSPEYDDLIEFGAVVVKNNQKINEFQFFIKPSKDIPKNITDITKITNDDVKNAKSEKEAMKDILKIFQNKTLVAHNANFDFTFLQTKAKKYGLPEINNPVIDTLVASWIIFNKSKRFRLEFIAKKCGVEYDTSISHRANYDANVLADIWTKQTNGLIQFEIYTQQDLFKYINNKLYEKIFSNEITILAKNQQGLKELFEIISSSLTTNLYSKGKIFFEDLQKYKNILIGSGALKSKLVNLIFTGSKTQIVKEISKYDYIEIQPLQNFAHKIAEGFKMEDLQNSLQFIINEAKKQGKIVVATGDVRYLEKHQRIYHEIYINAKGLGGVRHYLFNYNDKEREYPNQIMLTTSQMKKQFSFLKDKDLIDEIVVKNTNYIASLIEKIEVIKKGLFTPKIDGVDDKLENLVFDEAKKIYGFPLPKIVDKRLRREIEPIKKYGFSVIYWISHLLVSKSLQDGYLVGSRGSIGSSLVATFAKITEVNPLVPHYLCKNCKFSEFYTSSHLNSGYDLEDKDCPKCGIALDKEGQKIPFETFLGFEADKIPDIDLNFSGEYQPIIHNEVKTIFGDNHSFRAGTISTVAEKTAFGYVKTWSDENNKNISKAFIDFLTQGVAGTKRTTGQHPGGIIVIPNEMSIEDFSPVNYPANDKTSLWKTTHFDFHAIHDNVLKLDLLGHDDPTAIKYLEKLTGVNAKKDIPFYDKKVISLFSSTEALNIKPKDIDGETTGAMGIPEFGTAFVRKMLKSAKVSSFGDLIAISGLSHGTNVWTDNAQNIIKELGKNLSEVVSCRDNIMTDLIDKGIESSYAFEVMERVKKGMSITSSQEKTLIENRVEKWYIDSLKKIKYMFPKAHATAYVMMAWRIAWFKVYKPEAYYATYFTTRADVFDIISILKGHSYTITKLEELKKRKKSVNFKEIKPLSNREVALIPILELAIEAFARNIKIGNIDLDKSQACNWIIDVDKKLIPPFISIEGLGEGVANSIVDARKEKEFKSIEDLQQRTTINKNNLESLKSLGVLDHLSNENQMSLKDFFVV